MDLLKLKSAAEAVVRAYRACLELPEDTDMTEVDLHYGRHDNAYRAFVTACAAEVDVPTPATGADHRLSGGYQAAWRRSRRWRVDGGYRGHPEEFGSDEVTQ